MIRLGRGRGQKFVMYASFAGVFGDWASREEVARKWVVPTRKREEKGH